MLDRQGSRRWEKSRSLISPALSITAIIIALGGVAYAADLLPVNSVGHKQMRDKAVGTAELRGKAVGSRHLKAGAVGSEQLQANSVDEDALGVPIGASGVSDARRIGIVTSGSCGHFEGPGDDAPKCLPTAPERVLTDSIRIQEPSFLQVSGTVGISSEGVLGHTDGTATVDLEVMLGGPDLNPMGRSLSPRLTTDMEFGQHKVVPFEAFAEVPAGTHHIKLVLSGFGFDYLNAYATSAVMTTTVMQPLPE